LEQTPAQLLQDTVLLLPTLTQQAGTAQLLPQTPTQGTAQLLLQTLMLVSPVLLVPCSQEPILVPCLAWCLECLSSLVLLCLA
jgi:hypothetical protein